MKCKIDITAIDNIIHAHCIKYGLFLARHIGSEGEPTVTVLVTPHGAIFFEFGGAVSYSDRAHLNANYDIVRELNEKESVRIYGGSAQISSIPPIAEAAF